MRSSSASTTRRWRSRSGSRPPSACRSSRFSNTTRTPPGARRSEGLRRSTMDALLKYDFGYEWPWVYGHLAAAGAFLLLAGLAWWLAWPRALRIASAAGLAWALAGFAIVH